MILISNFAQNYKLSAEIANMDGVISLIITIGIAALVTLLKEKTKKKGANISAVPHIKAWEEELPAVKVFKEPIDVAPVTDFVSLPEEGARVSTDEPQEDMAERELRKRLHEEAHRQRWRRAMVDSIILQPKF